MSWNKRARTLADCTQHAGLPTAPAGPENGTELTRLVTRGRMIADMRKAPTICELTADDQASLDTCESVILCLDNRRFVVVRHGDPKDLWPIDGGLQKLRQLRPGDEVIYKGQRTQIRALDVYR